jgi:hypothetical protein
MISRLVRQRTGEPFPTWQVLNGKLESEKPIRGDLNPSEELEAA